MAKHKSPFEQTIHHMRPYTSAVINGVDAEGYPCSVRCQPEAEPDKEIFRINVATGLRIQRGPASLLFHSMNEQLWNLKSFGVRGLLEQGANGWIFRPTQVFGIDGNVIKMIFGLRRQASRYLKRSGEARPQVPWSKIRAAKKRERKEPAGR